MLACRWLKCLPFPVRAVGIRTGVTTGALLSLAAIALAANAQNRPAVVASRVATSKGGFVEGGFVIRPKRFYGTKPEDEGREALPLGGGTLAQIASIKRLPQGRVAVLDAAFKKVVIFDSTGRPRRIIGRGHGNGPGELLFPTAMAITHDTIAIFDYSQERVTLFDTAGKLLTSTPTHRAKDIAFVGGQLWGAKMPGIKDLIWQKSITGGVETTRSALPFDAAKHALYNPSGSVARLGDDIDGTTLIAHRPGLWYRTDQSGGIQGPFGVDLLGGQKYFVTRGGIVRAPGETGGIVGLSTAHIGILFSRATSQGPNQPARQELRRLGIFARNTGAMMGTAEFAEHGTRVTAIAPGGRPGEVLYAAYEPYPRVVLAEVVSARRP